jgi:hypothetical protein
MEASGKQKTVDLLGSASTYWAVHPPPHDDPYKSTFHQILSGRTDSSPYLLQTLTSR